MITGSLLADVVHNARQAATWCNQVTGSRFPNGDVIHIFPFERGCGGHVIDHGKKHHRTYFGTLWDTTGDGRPLGRCFAKASALLSVARKV